MVQILPQLQKLRKPTFGESLNLDKFLGRLGEGLGEGINKRIQENKSEEKRIKQAESLKGITGRELKDIYDPKLLEIIAQRSILNPKEQQEMDYLKDEEDEISNIIGNTFFENESEQNANPKKNKKSDISGLSDKQINTLRSIKSKNPRAQRISDEAGQEYERRQNYKKNVVPLKSALDVINRMESLGKKGNLGIGSKLKSIASSKTRKDRAEYERLGKSLIQLSTNIPIRNKQEFETLAHDLYDPSVSDSARDGILNAMRRIISNSMKEHENPEEQSDFDISAQNERPPLTAFLR